MKIRLTDPLPVSASFRISLSIGYGNYAPFGLSPAAFPLHAAAFLEACTACHAMPRERHQGRASYSPIVVSLFVCFRFPRFPTGFNINSCRQTGLKLMGTSVRWPSWLSWPRSCLLSRWSHPFLMLPHSSSLASLPDCRL